MTLLISGGVCPISIWSRRILPSLSLIHIFVVFNTPGANANAVKEIVLCALLLGSRDILGGIEWCRENADDENITKAAEKAKKLSLIHIYTRGLTWVKPPVAWPPATGLITAVPFCIGATPPITWVLRPLISSPSAMGRPARKSFST